MAEVKIFGKENGVAILLASGQYIYGDPDGDFVAQNGTASDQVSVKRTVNDFFVINDLVHTDFKDKDGNAIAANRDAVVTALNNNFFNRGSSISEIGNVLEDASIDKTQGKKLHLVMDSSNRFVVTNVADTQIDNALLSSEVLANGNAKIKLTKTQSNGVTGVDNVFIIKGTGITLGSQGGDITISGFSGNYSDLSGAPSLGAVATSNDYNDLTNLPTIPTDTNTNIGNTDMTLSGARAVNMNGNNLDFKDGSISKLKYVDSDDKWVFTVPVQFEKSTGGEVKLREPSSNGTEGVILKAPNTNLASDLTFTLPSADGANGQVLKTNGAGVLSFSSSLDGSPVLAAASTADLNGEDFTINVNGGNFFVKEASSTRLQVDQTDVVIQGLTFPTSDGSAGQVLKTNGSGVLSFVNQTADTNTQLTTEQVQDIVGAMFTSNTETRISATYEDSDGTIDLVVDDMTADTQLTTEQVQDIVGAMFTSNTETRISATYEDGDGTIDLVVDDMTGTELANDSSPQLGGDLDVSGNKITSASNGDVVIDPHGSGVIKLVADEIKMEGYQGTSVTAMKFYEFGLLEGNYIGLKAPFSIASDCEFVLPGADGSAGQVLKTDGSKNLSFTNALDGVNSELTGVTSVKDAGATRGTVSFYDDAGDNFTALRAADPLSADTVFHLPAADGSAGQFLKTDGSGNLSFGAAGGGTTLTQVYSQSFLDNIGTTKHYLPFKDINEQTTIYQEEAAMLMPFDGKVRSVSIRIPAITGTSGNMTIGVHTINTGNTGMFSAGSWTDEETETVAVANTDDHAGIHFVFDNAQHFEAGDLLAISIQCSTSLFGGSKYVYVSTILDYDTSNTMPASSQVLSSNP